MGNELLIQCPALREGDQATVSQNCIGVCLFCYHLSLTRRVIMAESLAIMGLASNIVSFIDFGLKLASGTRMILESIHGTTPEIRELELVVRNVERLNAEIIQQNVSGQTFSSDEQLILDMVQECDQLAGDIRKMMKKLIVRDGVRSKTLESGRVAFQVMRKHAEIDRLRNRLESMDEKLRRHITHVLQG